MNKFISAAACLAGTLTLAGSAHAQAATYAIDPTHTFVTFEASHFGTSTVRGRFDRKEGTVQFDRAAKTARLDLTLDMGSINTGVAPFNQHLQSKDFFNVAEHPSARFVADRVSFDGDRMASLAGTLTLLGKSGPVTLTASRFNCYINPIFKREVCGGDFSATLKRSLWGITYGIDFGIPDEVKLVIQAEAIKQ
jgi:polyisoprenoid-binding protein YceI